MTNVRSLGRQTRKESGGICPPDCRQERPAAQPNVRTTRRHRSPRTVQEIPRASTYMGEGITRQASCTVICGGFVPSEVTWGTAQTRRFGGPSSSPRATCRRVGEDQGAMKEGVLLPADIMTTAFDRFFCASALLDKFLQKNTVVTGRNASSGRTQGIAFGMTSRFVSRMEGKIQYLLGTTPLE